MKTSQQIRAMRTIENISRDELAEVTGLSRPTIANAEDDKNTVSGTTRDAITSYFVSLGYELLPNGVIKNDSPVIYLSGDDCYTQLLDDINKTVKSGDEILFDGADDRKSSPETDAVMSVMKNNGIKTRFLICEGNTVIKGDMQDYRWVPAEDFTENDVKVIYGSKVAVYIPAEESGQPQIMVLNNKRYANDKRKDFEFKWKHSGKVNG